MPHVTDTRELLTANLGLVERVSAFVCQRHRMRPEEAEEFASVVKLKLVEDDYAILRRFQGRSSLGTYLTVVIQRLLLDYRIHLWGKWHPSAEAKRLGDTAVAVERLLYRDGRTIEEASAILAAQNPEVRRDAVADLAARIPARSPRRRMVEIDEAESVASVTAEPSADVRRTSERVSTLITEFLARLPEDDRLILELRFDGDMSVAEIARSLRLDQKQLYRRMEKLFRELREELHGAGLSASDIASLIGDRGVVLDFRFGNRQLRPSSTSGGQENTP
jgi:RNA polymerase sigma factor for flagellar operon FliA